MRSSRVARALPVALFLFLIVIRVWGITDRFLMLGDQIRDWGIALGPFTSLPWVGPVTHVGGYTLGDALNPAPDFQVLESAPLINNEGFYDAKFWHVEVKNVGQDPAFFTVYAVCGAALR